MIVLRFYVLDELSRNIGLSPTVLKPPTVYWINCEQPFAFVELPKFLLSCMNCCPTRFCPGLTVTSYVLDELSYYLCPG